MSIHWSLTRCLFGEQQSQMLRKTKVDWLHLSLVADVTQADPLFSVAVWPFYATPWQASTARNAVQDAVQIWCLTKRPQPALSHLSSCCHGMRTDRILERVHLCEVVHVIIPQLLAQHASQEKPQKSPDLRLLIINQSTCWQLAEWELGDESEEDWLRWPACLL